MGGRSTVDPAIAPRAGNRTSEAEAARARGRRLSHSHGAPRRSRNGKAEVAQVGSRKAKTTRNAPRQGADTAKVTQPDVESASRPHRPAPGPETTKPRSHEGARRQHPSRSAPRRGQAAKAEVARAGGRETPPR
ncbi:hypothetical protein GCM10018785_64240 [Streptomyces longispororuber]|uniref:Uncharacterized protein n=1 Tax=Streptomyces longispororuber TaxID=68230 RepID=A0A919DV91_9ACTN|nr:hypothetical protein GCM10018785_64240 [Streptomyces longispororuber]